MILNQETVHFSLVSYRNNPEQTGGERFWGVPPSQFCLLAKEKNIKKERKEIDCELILWWEPILINQTEETF